MAEPADSQVALIFALGTAGMLLMAIAIIVFITFYQKRMIQEELKRQLLEVDHQKQMLQGALESQENERKRVSKDLHDDIGMMLMTVRTQVSAIVGKTLTSELASDIRTVVDETHETVRRLSWDLMPGTLERFGLELTIKEMCQRLSTPNSVPVIFIEIGKPSTLDKSQETHLFRIIQESVTNSLRHAHALRVEIHFRWDELALNITIADDGTGFDFPREQNKIEARRGLGLINIENRVGLLGAQINFEKNSPTGTLVKLKIPIKAS